MGEILITSGVPSLPVHPGSRESSATAQRYRRGRLDGGGPTVGVQDQQRLLGTAELGTELGRRATLVQFSTAFCQPCRATRRTLADVAGMVEGVAHIELDAEERLELVRELGIVKTPTVLVLDSAGRVVTRASGAPRRADVIAALGRAV
ncbi:thioredoxin family protein [Streptomyces sp. ISL-10]|nr:thioredoxin family protein [Streptomyces sp. ISL-10]